MLEKLLDNCDWYQQAIVYLIDLGIIRCVKQNDDSPVCFYIQINRIYKVNRELYEKR